MSVICQNVALFTATTVRTIVTVYVSTSLSQAVGRPATMTSIVASPSCAADTSGNSTSQRCTTFFSTITMQPIAAPPSQVQIPVTITSQIYQTQTNTLMGSSCRTDPGPQVPSSQPPQAPTPQSTPTQLTPVQPTPTPAPRPTPEPGITDTTFTTEYVTVTGSRPLESSTSILTSNTRLPTTSSLSRNTVYDALSAGDPSSEISPSNSALALASKSKGVPVAAIAGGAAGAVVLVILLGLLAYFLIFKKSPKGYQRPVGDDLSDQFYGSTNTGQSGLYAQMQEQGGYHPYEDGTGYGQQYQGTTASQSLQYSDYASPQTVNAQGVYTDSPGTQLWQHNTTSSGAAVTTLPAGAAAAVVVSHSPHPSTSSTASTAPLLSRGPHHQQPSFLVPYRGYAEPGDG